MKKKNLVFTVAIVLALFLEPAIMINPSQVQASIGAPAIVFVCLSVSERANE